MSRPRILVVDDLPANLAMLVDALADRYELRVAESGESALEQLPTAQPDLILLDLMLPGLDGFGVLARLQTDAQWQRVPVIFMTSVDDPAEKQRALEAGAVDYVTKPLFVPEVIARVETHLRLRGLQRELEKRNEELAFEVTVRREAEASLARSLDRAVLVSHADRQIVFASELAVTLLRRYFDCGPLLLPSAFEGQGKGGAVLAQADAVELHGHAFTTGNGSDLTVWLLEESGSTATPKRLMALGLTPREAEVLYWIAQGKANTDIASILETSVRTVHKHVENVLRKLDVDSRTAAALRAKEVS